MDPVTHALVGMGLSKLGGLPMNVDNPAFVGTVVGAVVPDLDIVLQKWGDYVYLKNHRGVSHSFIGLGVLAGVITACLLPFYKQMDFWNVFMWTLFGCLSHSFMDLLNSYGVQLLWPFYKKRIGFGLFIITDPFIVGLLLLYVISAQSMNMTILTGLIIYVLLRILMMYSIKYKVRHYFDVNKQNVNVIPSMIGIFKWHFIVQKSNRMIIGEKSVFKSKIKIIQELKALESKLLNRIIHTPIAKFFAEFTPFYHIAWSEAEKMFKFIDVRYYIKSTDSFLHHATAKVSDEFEVLDQKFHPYSMRRNVEIPG